MTGSYKAARIAKLHEQASGIQAEVAHLKNDPGSQLDAVVQAYMDTHDNVQYSEALEHVMGDPEHAELARRYRASFPHAEEKDISARKA